MRLTSVVAVRDVGRLVLLAGSVYHGHEVGSWGWSEVEYFSPYGRGVDQSEEGQPEP